ncbi:helicase-related protein [Sphingomonas sp. PvP018]|uniref:helicase-related protein n=1 Tax=Sphingomonas sp. PvP018 TaxID=2817852 RepID=UPI001AE670D3|nr:helicase-related protein [Sphingomonas sp. PvP018]MBP2512664.1 hypothetical protein [Sphingomonas sp. PvP018]
MGSDPASGRDKVTENRSEPTRFQKRTIDYVIRRFWDDAEPARRFLVADEVGLGKTVVAREVLAEALRRRPGESVDIVYLCSSQPVASQNLKRLKVRGHGGTRKATRLTMLALEPATPGGVRYFALTPDTSFKVSGKSGTVRERALIHACLRRTLRGDRFDAVIRQVSEWSWERETARMAAMTLDPRVVDAFREAVRADADLLEDVRRVGRDILEAPKDERLERGLKRRRDEVVGRLRRHLAIHSAQAMASNGLVIVDEFQRFATLFDTRRIDTDIAVRLVDSLLSRSVPDRRVLLLSATPYRIPGAETVPGQTPYADFVTLVRFLADEPTAVDLAEALDRYAQALRSNPPEVEAIVAARNDARAILRPIMCRTERTGAASNPNAMVREETRALDPGDGDLAGAVSARRIARRLKVRDPVEYWKSAPFLLDFMRDYQFRTSVNDAPEGDRPFVGRQARHGRLVLDKPALRRLDPLAVPSARLRDLVDDAMPAGSERLLWTPPSLPYVKPGGEYARTPNDLKRLVFTEWRLAPDAIAALTSYVVEQRLDAGLRASHAKRTRRSDGGQGLRHKRFGDLGNMLRLGRANQGADEPTLAMLPLLLLLSGQRMADWGDPLPHAIEAGGPADPATVLRAAAAHVRSALRRLPPSTSTGRVDERWYWAAPLLIEGAPSLHRWLADDDPFLASSETTPPDLERVRAAISAVVEDPGSLGRRPRDLAQVVAKTAVAAPGACAYRALRRTASGPVTEAQLRRSAFHVARGFQSLFNQSEAAAAVQLEQPGRKRVFWDQVLDYSLSGNLQAVLDEHLHFEADGLAMFDGTNAEKLQMAAKAVHTALTLRRASIDVHGLGRRRAAGSEDRDLVRLRCRHGARFAEVKEPNGEVSRLDVVRGAFNSPFRPFVLASTAVGQEGLDFHPWCHAVVHWNLPRSPVELEQREGRVHRYKGHAVRLNVASAIGLSGLTTNAAAGDPWQALFDAAALQDKENELSPCWLFEPTPEAVRIRRIVPFLRYSREEEAWPRLRARLATYRLALGLPRADDLLEALERNGVTAEQSAEWKIDLHPPPARVRNA